jgi:predicted nucleic acid-binding protein
MFKPCVVFDTCAMIAIIKNKIENGPIASLPVNINALISVITRIELLSYPNLSASEDQQIRMLLKKRFKVVSLNNKIEQIAMFICPKTKLKLPDSIIAATAISKKALLISGDTQLLSLKWPGYLIQGIY